MEGTNKKGKGKKTIKKVKQLDLKFNLEANLQQEEPDLLSQKSKILDDDFKVVMQTGPKKEQLEQLSLEFQKVQIAQQKQIVLINDNNNSVDIQKESFLVINPVEKEQTVVETIPLPQIQLNKQQIQTGQPINKIEQQTRKQIKIEKPRQEQIALEEQFGIMKFSIEGKSVIKKQEGTKVKPSKKKKDTKKTGKSSIVQQNFDLFQKTEENEDNNDKSKVQTKTFENLLPQHFAPKEMLNKKEQDIVQTAQIEHDYGQQITNLILPQKQQIYVPETITANIQDIQLGSKVYYLPQQQIKQQTGKDGDEVQPKTNIISAYIQYGDAFRKAEQFDISKIEQTPALSSNLNNVGLTDEIADVIEERVTANSKSIQLQNILQNGRLVGPLQTKSQEVSKEQDKVQKQVQFNQSEQPIAMIQLTKVNVKKGKKVGKSSNPKKLPKSIITENLSDNIFEMTNEQQKQQLKSKQIIEKQKDNQYDVEQLGKTIMINKEDLSIIQDIVSKQIANDKEQIKEQEILIESKKSEQQYIEDKKELTVINMEQKFQESVESKTVALKEQMDNEQNYFVETQIIELSVHKKKAGKKEAKSKRNVTIKMEISEQPQLIQQSESLDKREQTQVMKQIVSQKKQEFNIQQLHQQTITLEEVKLQGIDTDLINIQVQKEIVLSIPFQIPTQFQEDSYLQKEKVQEIQSQPNIQNVVEYSQIELPKQIKETKKGGKKGDKLKSKTKPVKLVQQIQFVVEEQKQQKQLEDNRDIPVQYNAEKEQKIMQRETLKNVEQETSKIVGQQNQIVQIKQIEPIFKLEAQIFPLNNQLIQLQEHLQTIQMPINPVQPDEVLLRQQQLNIQRQPQMQKGGQITSPFSQIYQIQIKQQKPEQNVHKEGQLALQESQTLLIQPQIIKANTKPSKKGAKKHAQKKKKQAIVQIFQKQNNLAPQIQKIQLPHTLQQKKINLISQIQIKVPQIINVNDEKNYPSQQSHQLPKQPSIQGNTEKVKAETGQKTSLKNPIVNQLINLIRFHNDEQIRNMRERIKMLEEDIRSRMMRTQQMKKQDHIQALTHYQGQSQLFKDIVEENLSLKKEYTACKNR